MEASDQLTNQTRQEMAWLRESTHQRKVYATRFGAEDSSSWFFIISTQGFDRLAQS
jgi:hypothetical protein